MNNRLKDYKRRCKEHLKECEVPERLNKSGQDWKYVVTVQDMAGGKQSLGSGTGSILLVPRCEDDDGI